jgi:hypothetical protein
MAVPVPILVTITTAPVLLVSQVSEISFIYFLLPFISVTFPLISIIFVFVGRSDFCSQSQVITQKGGMGSSVGSHEASEEGFCFQ